MNASQNVGKAIIDPKDELNALYPSYEWVKTKSITTNLVSNACPINMQNELFTKKEIEEAITISGITSDYGDCGPIAMLGILDYFARYMGYSEIIDDINSSEKRIELAVKVFKNIKTYESSSNTKDHIEFNLRKFSTDKDSLNEYKVLLPKGVKNVRFYSIHSKPTGDRNKGRIVLKNIKFNYCYLK